MKKLIYLFLTVLIVACSDDDGNPCLYNPTLTTSAVTNITETSATLNGVISIVSENCDDPNNTEQGFVYATTIQPTTANTKVNVNGTEVSTTLENLEPNTTYYARTFLTNALGEFYGNEVSFITTEEPVNCDDVVYLADNGITIKAYECAEVGDTGVINGITYTVVDEAVLRAMVANEEDVTKVVTTKVTDMSNLLYNNDNVFYDFNQDISSWDVSNVTDMSGMLGFTPFNQDISSWDVSNVTDMSGMFYFATSFNQPIGSWDVSNVTDMSVMFNSAQSFNQPIGNWNVSNVIDMRGMFNSAQSFNQPIGNWDVSNVTDMSEMFARTYAFNQPIGNWDVSNVTDMYQMFHSARDFNQPLNNWDVSNVTTMREMFFATWAFNQPIGNWDVSNVTTMSSMFSKNGNLGTNLFNQDISNWDVSNVTDMSYMFNYSEFFNRDIGNWDVSNVIDMYKMFYFATSFNKDLSSWSVDGVTSCSLFSANATSWTLPQPNFTNCTP